MIKRPTSHLRRGAALLTLLTTATLLAAPLAAQERLPWDRSGAPPAESYGAGGYRGQTATGYGRANDAYVPPAGGAYSQTYSSQPPYAGPAEPPPLRRDDTYRPPARGYDDSYRPPARSGGDEAYRPAPSYGDPYRPSPEPYERNYGGPPPRASDYDAPPPRAQYRDNSYSENEVLDAGHRFFGSVSQGLAKAVEYVFKRSGRPNGYILGEDAGGAFVAGLRYGEGVLYTKDAGRHKVYWQGPSLGYDFGGEGSKTMVLVYNLRDPSDIYHRFAGVQGSAYVIGGVGVQFQKYGDVTLAPIRSGIGLRLGANVGYLKYTRAPTWNPF